MYVQFERNAYLSLHADGLGRHRTRRSNVNRPRGQYVLGSAGGRLFRLDVFIRRARFADLLYGIGSSGDSRCRTFV